MIIIKKPGQKTVGRSNLVWQNKAGGGAKLRTADALEAEMFKHAAGVEITRDKNGLPVLEDKKKLDLWKFKRETEFNGRLKAVKQLYLERLDELFITSSKYEYVDDLALVVATEILNEKGIKDLYKLFRPKDEIKLRQILFLLTLNYLKREFPRLKIKPLLKRD
jgi:hypothetical protein